MLARLRALLIIDPLIVLFTVVLGTLSMAASLFDSSGHTQHRIARAWSRLLLWASGVHVRIDGLEKIDPAASYVLAANHLSLMDTPIVMAYIPLQFRFFAKKGLFSIPFLGWHLRRAGHLQVVYDDPRASARGVTEAAKRLRQRSISVLLFPEGGRSPGALEEFKEGAAYLAIKAGVPVVPMGIQGTREIVPMGSVIVCPGPAWVRIGDPIPTASLKLHDRAELTHQLRERVGELMKASPGLRSPCTGVNHDP